MKFAVKPHISGYISSWGLKNAANNDKISAEVAWNAQKACGIHIRAFFFGFFQLFAANNRAEILYIPAGGIPMSFNFKAGFKTLWQKLDIKPKTLAVDLIYDVIGCVLYGFGVVNFAEASNFAPGGVTGLAMFLKHYTGLDIGLGTVLINIPIVILCFKALGFKFFLRSAKTIVISAIIVDNLMELLPKYDSNPLLAACPYLYEGFLHRRFGLRYPCAQKKESPALGWNDIACG